MHTHASMYKKRTRHLGGPVLPRVLLLLPRQNLPLLLHNIYRYIYIYIHVSSASVQCLSQAVPLSSTRNDTPADRRSLPPPIPIPIPEHVRTYIHTPQKKNHTYTPQPKKTNRTHLHQYLPLHVRLQHRLEDRLARGAHLLLDVQHAVVPGEA